MWINWQDLSKDAFRGLVEAYVLANYSEVGDLDQSLASKTKVLMQEIQAGQLVLWFDPDETQVMLLNRDQVNKVG